MNWIRISHNDKTDEFFIFINDNDKITEKQLSTLYKLCKKHNRLMYYDDFVNKIEKI
jgi:hypothetical protein